MLLIYATISLVGRSIFKKHDFKVIFLTQLVAVGIAFLGFSITTANEEMFYTTFIMAPITAAIVSYMQFYIGKKRTK